jgi:hypothetical protein
MRNMKKLSLFVLAALACACAGGAGPDIAYRPAPQILPANIRRIAVRLVTNKTQQFGLEDKLTLAIRDNFLKDGRYLITPEPDADGVVNVTIMRYILTPIQYDSNLVPTAYKLRVVCDLQFIDRASNTMLWEEDNMEGIQTYAALTLPGGLTEEQARMLIWDTLSRDIVKRVVFGFGSVTGTSQRRISGEGPSTVPNSQPNKPLPPVTNPY